MNKVKYVGEGDELNEVLIMPTSGGGLFTQCGLLCNILEANRSYRPKICMGSSGGCIATHIAVAANFIPEYIINIATKLSYRDYIKKEYTPTPLRILYRNHIYNNADSSILDELVIGAITCEVEIWIGVFNRSISKAGVICNLPRSNTLLKFDNEEFETSPAIYLNGDRTEIIKAIKASINIPVFMPEVNIQGNNYSDGGGRYASPISSLRDEVNKLRRFHIIYISSDNLNHIEPRVTGGVISTFSSTINELIRESRITDLQVARDLVGRNSVQLESLDDYFRIRTSYDRTVLEVYPSVPNNVDILNFSSAEAKQCLKYSSINMKLRMWW